MILLFEDRPSRLRFEVSEAELSEDILSGHHETIKLGKLTSADSLEELDSPQIELVLFHESYKFVSNSGLSHQIVDESLSELSVHYVRFSGGNASTSGFNVGENGKVTGNIRSDIMYKNLPILLKWFKTKDVIEPRVLYHGNEFLRAELLKFKKKSDIFLSSKTTFSLDELLDYQEDVFEVSLVGPEFATQKQKIGDFIQSQRASRATISKRDFRSQIMKLIS